MFDNQHSILDTSLEFLKGIGSIRAALLRTELQLTNYESLLHYYPYRYDNRSQILPINAINHQTDTASIAGTLANFRLEGEGAKRRLVATLYDETGRIELVWFQAIAWTKNNLKEGEKYLVYGKVNFFNGIFNIAHPEVELLKSASSMAGLQPVYSTTEKLKAKAGFTNRSFAKLTQALFEKLTPADLPEILPHYLIEHYKLCTRYDALQWIHFPPTEEHAAMARHRLKWEELFLSQLTIARIRLQNQKQPGFLFDKVGDNFNIFYENHLPFSLTGAQKRVLKEIRRDTRTGNQMNRLLQGDVGSGKTMVALMTMLLAIDNGYQACLMAPTEILARQHYESISAYLQAMNVPVVLLIGSIKGKQRKEILKLLQAGLVLIAIGTHALIEDKVIFKNLGMAVIDEQHRFGVGQRAQLWKKNTLPPHILVMTATPIPRTLAMTLYGDLEVSELDELPPGRQPIQTLHRKEEARMAVMHFIRDEIDRGRQAYIVYPLIDESETLDYESLIAGYEQVKMWFNENKYRIAIVHGKQDPEEREINMKRFVSGHAHILVATTVIEVGVNVPNASVMFIESAERFGLSQLHQLRGRVGRGAEKSYCILMTGNKISDDSYKRVQIMVATNNGFEIAEKDMEMRGPGDMHGTRQSGALQFKLADIVEDKGILHETRLAAQHLLANDPSLEHPNHLSLKKLLAKKKDKNEWGKIS